MDSNISQAFIDNYFESAVCINSKFMIIYSISNSFDIPYFNEIHLQENCIPRVKNITERNLTLADLVEPSRITCSSAEEWCSF